MWSNLNALYQIINLIPGFVNKSLIKQFSMKIKLIFLTIIMIVLPSCNCKCDEGETAESIIRNYYKNKQIGSKSLSEEQRVLLDSVVLKLEETGEPRSVIQYIIIVT